MKPSPWSAACSITCRLTWEKSWKILSRCFWPFLPSSPPLRQRCCYTYRRLTKTFPPRWKWRTGGGWKRRAPSTLLLQVRLKLCFRDVTRPIQCLLLFSVCIYIYIYVQHWIVKSFRMFPFNFTATPCFEFSSSPVNIPLGAEKGKKWRNENSITNTDVSVVRNFRLNFLDTTVYFFYLRRGYFVDNRTKWARWNERKTTEIYLCFFFLFFLVFSFSMRYSIEWDTIFFFLFSIEYFYRFFFSSLFFLGGWRRGAAIFLPSGIHR